MGVVDQKSVQDHEFCLRCGRKLKASKARKIGYGPVCERKMQTIQKSRLFDVESGAESVEVST